MNTSVKKEKRASLVETYCSQPLGGINPLHASRINVEDPFMVPSISAPASLSPTAQCEARWLQHFASSITGEAISKVTETQQTAESPEQPLRSPC